MAFSYADAVKAFQDAAASTGADISRLDPETRRRVIQAIAAAEAATGQKAQINSGYRTYEDQAQSYANDRLYNTGAKSWTDPATKITYVAQHPTTLAAYPGTSYHELGQAVDIQPGPVLDWIKTHAADYGLEGLAGSAGSVDPVHIQLARGSQAPQVPPPSPNLRPGTEVAGNTQLPSVMPTNYTSSLAGASYVPGVSASSPTSADTGANWQDAYPQYPLGMPSDALVASNQPPPQFVDDLGHSGMSKIYSVPAGETSNVPKGPYGAENLINAAIKGDQGGVQWGMIGMGLQAGGDLKNGVAEQRLTDYFNNLQANQPGAVRAAQTQFAQNPNLWTAIPADYRPMLQQAFDALPPAPSGNVFTPRPNLRPPMPESPQAPAVAQSPQAPPPPTLASYGTSSPAPQQYQTPNYTNYTSSLAGANYGQEEPPQQPTRSWTAGMGVAPQPQQQPGSITFQDQPAWGLPLNFGDTAQTPRESLSWVPQHSWARGVEQPDTPFVPVTPQTPQMPLPQMPSMSWTAGMNFPQPSPMSAPMPNMRPSQYQPLTNVPMPNMRPPMPNQGFQPFGGLFAGLGQNIAGFGQQAFGGLGNMFGGLGKALNIGQPYTGPVAQPGAATTSFANPTYNALATQYDRPVDSSGNFVPDGVGWTDPSQFLPDMDAQAAGRYYVPQM